MWKDVPSLRAELSSWWNRAQRNFCVSCINLQISVPALTRSGLHCLELLLFVWVLPDWGHDVSSEFVFHFRTFILFFSFCSSIWPVFDLFSQILPFQCCCPHHCWLSGQGVVLQPLDLSPPGCFGVRVVWSWSRTVFIRDLLIHTSLGNRGIAKRCVRAGSVPLHQNLFLWSTFCETWPWIFFVSPHSGSFSFSAEHPASERSESQLGEL